MKLTYQWKTCIQHHY